jgi:hypothetical protein
MPMTTIRVSTGRPLVIDLDPPIPSVADNVLVRTDKRHLVTMRRDIWLLRTIHARSDTE